MENKIVDAIINDILDRKGLGDEWTSLDTNIQNEIKARWEECIRGVE